MFVKNLSAFRQLFRLQHIAISQQQKLNKSVPVFATRLFSVSSAAFGPRKYTDKHEWISVDGNIGTVGISNYAQEALGEIVYCQVPDVGSDVKQHSECGTLESVKAASDVYAPATGTVSEKNARLEEKPSLINKSCYDKGWLFKMKLSAPKEIDSLMDEQAYEKYLKTLEH